MLKPLFLFGAHVTKQNNDNPKCHLILTKYRLLTYNSIVIHASKNTKGTLHGVMSMGAILMTVRALVFL